MHLHEEFFLPGVGKLFSQFLHIYILSAFGDVTSCSLVDRYQRFGNSSFLQSSGRVSDTNKDEGGEKREENQGRTNRGKDNYVKYIGP
jgi:hypothetical protein